MAHDMLPERPLERCSIDHPKKSWVDLPLELQSSILKAVSENHCQSFGRRAYSLSPFASVCLDWQFFFEKITFGRLTFDDSMLKEFDEMVQGQNKIRLTYIKHIWLQIKLPKYTCAACFEPEDALTIYGYVGLFSIYSTNMRYLLGIQSDILTRPKE